MILLASLAVDLDARNLSATKPPKVADASVEMKRNADGRVIALDIAGFTPAELSHLAKLRPEDRAKALEVRVGNADPGVPPIRGTLNVEGARLRFTPRFPLAEQLPLRILLRPNVVREQGNSEEILIRRTTPAGAPRPSTRVVSIYPSADRLPENLLRFYIHFSAPMSRGEAYRRIHLRDASDREMEGAFLELEEELWDRPMQRFTLLFDPGRVKRGLLPREELGSVLQEGQSYTLVIDGDWSDAQGQKLAASTSKQFQIMSPDTAPIDPAAWTLVSPPVGSREPLTVRFPKPLDHALLHRMLSVENESGEILRGGITVSAQETRWQWIPEQPWQAGRHALVVETILEDVAGNSLARPFDVDLKGAPRPEAADDTHRIPFFVRTSE
jgi:hypothetical protein